MDAMSILGTINSIVPITRFNKGEAGKVFDEVEKNGIKIVVKNNKPACILLSPEQYETLMEMLSDNILCEEAEKRVASSQKTYSHAEVMRELGITEDMLAAADVEVDEA